MIIRIFHMSLCVLYPFTLHVCSAILIFSFLIFLSTKCGRYVSSNTVLTPSSRSAFVSHLQVHVFNYSTLLWILRGKVAAGTALV